MKKILLIFLTFILVLFSVSFLKKKSEENALFQKKKSKKSKNSKTNVQLR